MFDKQNCETISMLEAKTREEQNPLSAALRASSITFVKIAEAGQVDNTTILENASLFSSWGPSITYTKNAICRHGGAVYRCSQEHKSQENVPPNLGNFWEKIGTSLEEFLSWAQPIGAADAYSAGSKVKHKEEYWVSTENDNIWEPGVRGWQRTTA